MSNDIKQLAEVIQNYIDDKSVIIEKKISRFSSPGENYGGILLKADLTLMRKDENGFQKKDTLCLVIKTIPPTEYFQILFNTQVSVKAEISFYETIVPCLNGFLMKYGDSINHLFPKFYGGRLNLHETSDRVDQDSIIVLQNLKREGYINVDRFEGCDISTTKLILSSIAKFHAVPLAVKVKKPELFSTKIKPYFCCNYPKGDIPTVPTTGMMDILCENEDLAHLYDKVKKSLLKIYEFTEDIREPFCTLTHRDLWINNILVQFDKNIPIDVKFIDFQKYSYDSPAKDLIYFLITSVPLQLLRSQFDFFLKFYHECLIECLMFLRCDIRPFSFNEFMKEVGLCIEEQLGHTLFMMLFVAYGKEGGADKIDGKVIWDNKNNVPPEGREKFRWFIQECIDRNWF